MNDAPNWSVWKEENMTQNNETAPVSSNPSSIITMVCSLAISMPNEEFGLLSRWMTSEANRRRERVAIHLKKGDDIVFINYSDKLTRGVVQKLGVKNALIKTENGGRMYVPLARLERVSDSSLANLGALATIPSLASLPSVAPPGMAPTPVPPPPRPSEVTTLVPKTAKAAAKSGTKARAKKATKSKGKPKAA